jgi:anaerobic ribonucleoside-triphosphate reductase activating protein
MRLKIFHSQHNQSAYGPYRATVVWTAGCSIRCPGCFNPHLFDEALGQARSPLWLLQLARSGRKLGDSALVFVGGEPLDQPAGLFCGLLLLRLMLPRMTITVYTGYTCASLVRSLRHRLVLHLVDYLIDGPFLARQASDELGCRGSANQRVIDLKASRSTGHISILDWDRMILIDQQSIAAPPLAGAHLGLSGTAEACGRAPKEAT